MTRFSVIVPFDPVVHENLDTRVFAQLPDSDLASGLVLRGGSDGYTLQLVVDAESPGAAKRAGLEAAERFFSVLATWNHGFQARFAGVRSERIEEPESGSVAQSAPGVFAVSASDTLFVEAHVEAVVRKANLEAEGDVFDRYANLPEYARSSLELNYLLVLSTRPPNRWLLAAIGLEALTVGAAGHQQTLASQLGPDKDRQLQAVLRTALHDLGLDDLADKVGQRVRSTPVNRVADHVRGHLARLGVTDATADQINRWWRIRSALAHGDAVDIDQGELNRLITVFQTALRRSVGAEQIPHPAEP
jgi:hypothetical protein